jgi:hypothetical protein
VGKNTAQRPESEVQSIFVVVTTEFRTIIAHLWQKYEELQITLYTYTSLALQTHVLLRGFKQINCTLDIGHLLLPLPTPKKKSIAASNVMGRAS